MIKVGVSGMGRWGQNLVNSVQGTSSSISFTSGSARTPAKVAEFANEKGLAVFDSYEAMLAEADIDAVVLATPHSMHFEQMLAAANALYSELSQDESEVMRGPISNWILIKALELLMDKLADSNFLKQQLDWLVELIKEKLV